MADPYKAYDDDDDEDLENIDPAVAAAQDAAYEAETLEKAIQLSLESFTQEQGNPVQAQEEADQVPQNSRDHGVPHRPFTAEEIAQDDLRRESELYGPPSPPRKPRTVASLNSNVETFTPRVASTLDANDIVRIIKGKAKESVKRNASDSGKVYEKGERIMEDFTTAMGASWLTNATRYSLEDSILTVKMVMLLGSIRCPPVYSAATYEIASIVAGLEDIVVDTTAADTTAAAATEPTSNCSECSNAAVAGSSRGSESPGHLSDTAGMDDAPRVDNYQVPDTSGGMDDARRVDNYQVPDTSGGMDDARRVDNSQVPDTSGGMDDARRVDNSQVPDTSGAIVEQPTSEIAGQTINDNESALLGSAAPPEDGASPVDAVVALDVPDDADESSRLGQNFDDMLARRYEARVADIEALLDIENVSMHAAIQAAHDRRIARGAPAAVSVQAARSQNASAGPSSRVAGGSAREEELEWFLDESPGNARPGVEQAQSPGKKSQPEHGKVGFDGRGKPMD